MNLIIPLNEIRAEDRDQVGGKASSLATMIRMGLNVPDALCVKAEAYKEFTALAGLKERILLELNRKNFQEMRWEEMWDTSLRIRNMFLNAPLPAHLLSSLRAAIDEKFKDKPVVVRSSAPGEDSSHTSFAGLHDSYVNVKGPESILDHIRLVWASLWSDGALLYRQELGLDFENSTMAVLVQEIITGEKSGVAFGKNPNNESQAVIESVYGLNAGMVDGTVEPDRWILDRKTGKILSRTPVTREKRVLPSDLGIRLEPLPGRLSKDPPLGDEEVHDVFNLARKAETLFVAPQDVEWTFRGNSLYILQSRPITTISSEGGEDKRPWYLSLRRSFESLKTLRRKIEGELIPSMIEDAANLSRLDLTELSDHHLAEEIRRRKEIYDRWVETYNNEFIPFAHGMRLFGQFYNDAVRPQDPYEFMDLLGSKRLASLERNRMLDEMASMIQGNIYLAEYLRNSEGSADETFSHLLDTFIETFGDLSCSVEEGNYCSQGKEGIIRLLLEMSSHHPAKKKERARDPEALMSEFLSHFEGEQKTFASEILDLGRASYQMRDDDNIYLGRVEKQVMGAMDEGRRRTTNRAGSKSDVGETKELINVLIEPSHTLQDPSSSEKNRESDGVKARQIVGQPAGPGIATGKARVILDAPSLFDFKSGEILVCDAVEPNMTFVVPLCAGIVERRGGMLIHGAIIAREYGLPCVTGVPNATTLIRTGDTLTVDGYLGIVIIG
jgi:pyruvate,water dikinase